MDKYDRMSLSQFHDNEFEEFEKSKWPLIQTGKEWAEGKPGKRRPSHHRFVEPDQVNHTPEDWPYSFSAHYLWGEKEKGYSAEYSDRLHQFSAEKYKLGLDAVRDLNCRFGYWGKEGTDKFLSAYYGKPIDSIAVAEECNRSSGYQIYIFWFKEKSDG